MKKLVLYPNDMAEESQRFFVMDAETAETLESETFNNAKEAYEFFEEKNRQIWFEKFGEYSFEYFDAELIDEDEFLFKNSKWYEKYHQEIFDNFPFDNFPFEIFEEDKNE